eukprot:5015196-Lingulodinium_polyedra.AAC.1
MSGQIERRKGRRRLSSSIQDAKSFSPVFYSSFVTPGACDLEFLLKKTAFLSLVPGGEARGVGRRSTLHHFACRAAFDPTPFACRAAFDPALI